MKMKTQIKRKAKRTLSLLLTAMLIISTMVVSLSVVNAAGSDGYQTACMHLIGEFTGKNWDSNQTKYDIDTAYNTGVSDGLFYYEATVTPNTTYYFALYSNDNRYAPATQHTVIANSKESAMSGDYSHTSNSWEYTSGANTTKVRICVDQYSPDEKWYPLVWIEDESVEPTTSAPTSEYYLWTSPNSNPKDSAWTKHTMTYSDNGLYVFDQTFDTTSDCYITITESDTDSYSTMVWTSSDSVEVTNNTSIVKRVQIQNYYVGSTQYHYPQLILSKTGTITISYDPSTKGVALSDSSVTPTEEPTTEEPTTVEPTTVEPTTVEPSTVEPTTVEPTTVAPTTAPSATEWYLKGTFNSWGTTNQLRGSGNELTANVYIDNKTIQEFKIWNKNGDKYYGTQTQTSVVNKTIENYVVYEAALSTLNVKFQPEKSGIYKFTFNPSTFTLNAELLESTGLNAEINVPDSVKAGEVFSVTAKAIPDSTLSVASYKFTIMVDGKAVVSGATSTTEQYTYNKATLSTPSSVSTYVEAYDADGNIIAVSPTVEKSVKVTYEDFSVKIATAKDEVAKDTAVTFTATATPASYVSSYDFYVSESFDFTGAEPVNQALSSYIYTFDKAGTYYIKVVAHNKYAAVVNDASSALDATSNILQVNVFDEVGKHDVTFYFKSPSAFAYTPKMVLDGTTLTVEKDAKLGEIFSGSVTFYWYKATASNLDSSKEHTLSISTRRTNASGSITSKFYGDTYWLAIDNLMSGKNLVNLTPLQEYIRNYYHSPLHTVYAGKADDGTLGFTNIGGTRYAMGTYTEGDPSQKNEATLSVKAATAAQKAVSKLDTYSEVQTCLLDVNLDGKVDVLDATMIQKAVVKLI